jgi:hypothetical protein
VLEFEDVSTTHAMGGELDIEIYQLRQEYRILQDFGSPILPWHDVQDQVF